MRAGRAPRLVRPGAIALLAATWVAGCATLQQMAALRQVDFAVDRVTGARIAGIDLALRARPVVDSPLGPIRYPEPITIVNVRLGGGH